MKKLLATGDGYTREQFARLATAGFEVVHRVDVEREELRSLLPILNAYVLGGNERLDRELLSTAAQLKVVSFVGTGYGAFIDAEAASEQGVTICNTPGIMADAVAEHTIGLLVGLARGLFGQNDAVKRERIASRIVTRELREMAVGVIGMGAIGTRVARILVSAFGCGVVYHSRHRKPDVDRELGIEFLPLNRLLEVVDAIVLLLPTAPDTIGLLDRERLAMTKRGVFIVNTAGACLVNPEALKEALATRHIHAAAFDGYWIEPIPRASADALGLLSLPDEVFVVTPHTAAKTHSSWPRMLEMAIDNIVLGDL